MQQMKANPRSQPGASLPSARCLQCRATDVSCGQVPGWTEAEGACACGAPIASESPAGPNRRSFDAGSGLLGACPPALQHGDWRQLGPAQACLGVRSAKPGDGQWHGALHRQEEPQAGPGTHTQPRHTDTRLVVVDRRRSVRSGRSMPSVPPRSTSRLGWGERACGRAACRQPVRSRCRRVNE